MSLYETEAQVAKEVLGTKRIHEWKVLSELLEARGFPKIDPLFGGRYMPAVRAWLDAYNRVANISPPRRGRETWLEPTPQASSGANGRRENVYPIGSHDQT